MKQKNIPKIIKLRLTKNMYDSFNKIAISQNLPLTHIIYKAMISFLSRQNMTASDLVLINENHADKEIKIRKEREMSDFFAPTRELEKLQKFIYDQYQNSNDLNWKMVKKMIRSMVTFLESKSKYAPEILEDRIYLELKDCLSNDTIMKNNCHRWYSKRLKKFRHGMIQDEDVWREFQDDKNRERFD